MPIDAKKLTTAGLFRGFGILLLVSSLLFLLDGLHRLHQENIESAWTQTQGQLIHCYVQETYSVMRRRGDYYRTVCTFRYTVNSEMLESHTKTTATQSLSMVNRMGVRVSQHHNGSLQTIHYNPAQPREISLAGADSEIQTFTAAGQLGNAKGVAIAGVFFVALALVLRKRKSDTSSSTDLLASSGTQ